MTTKPKLRKKKDDDFKLIEAINSGQKNLFFDLVKRYQQRLYNFGLRMCRDDRWTKLFGLPPRPAESELDQPYMDMALAIQQVTEEVVMRLALTAKRLTGCDKLVLAGGVALNCVANGKLIRSGEFSDLWIQPAAGDAGGALGAAYSALHTWTGAERTVNADGSDKMQGSYLGPAFTDADVQRLRRKCGNNTPWKHYEDFGALCEEVADLLSEGKIVGWFQGRMEWGPRALGNRSIIADPRRDDMKDILNARVKHRERFRPFAPSILLEAVGDYFDQTYPDPFMIKVYNVLPEKRADIPAVTHVDGTGRLQTIDREINPLYWQLIKEFENLTSVPVVLNTSFNENEPIVCSPQEAIECFLRTKMDALVIGNYLVRK